MTFVNVLLYLLTSSLVLFTLYVVIIFSRHNFSESSTHKGITLLLSLLLLRFLCLHWDLNGNIENNPHFLLVNQLTSRIGIPFFFIIVYHQITKKTFSWWDLLHVLPVLFFILNFATVILMSGEEKLQVLKLMKAEGQDYVWTVGVITSSFWIQSLRFVPFLTYTVFILYFLFKSRKTTSVPQHLRSFFIVMLCFVFVNLISSILLTLWSELFNKYLIVNIIGLFSTLVLVVSFFFIPNFLYGKTYKYLPYFQKSLDVLDESIQKLKAGQNKKTQLIEKIEAYFASEKPFLCPEFSLKVIEKDLSIAKKLISISIKDRYAMNFNQFINYHRLEFFKNDYIKNSKVMEKNMNDIAFDLGFASISNFYVHFKSQMNCTPKDFIEQWSSSEDIVTHD